MPTIREAWLLVVVACAAVVVVSSGIGNGFAYDDVGLLVLDGRLHSVTSLPGRALEPWWDTGLFRPVTLVWLGVQWDLGSGSPLVFHVVNSLLYAVTCVAVYLLLRRSGLPSRTALPGAMLFVVHPVHAEVTANVVGQAELLSALFAVLTVIWYIDARRRPRFRRRDVLAVTLLFLLSAHAKEGGFVVPGLLLAAELLLVRDPRPFRERWNALRELVSVLVMVFVGSLWIRQAVLGGLGGETPHIALRDLSALERAIAMLAVVPEWVRLLLFPARLQAEYGPPGLEAVPIPGFTHVLGLAILLIVAWSIVVLCRRQPLIAFGLSWMVIALAPVTNIVFPTGILLAERTLFLPSVGMAIVLAGVLTGMRPLLVQQRWWRAIELGALPLILLGAGLKTAQRQPLWRDTLTILTRTSQDAADSYRAQYVYGRELQATGRLREAEEAFRRAVALWDRDPRPYEELGQLLRVRGACVEAIPVLSAGVRADSTSDVARSRLVECLMVERRWAEAEREIERGLAQGVTAYRGALDRIARARNGQGIARLPVR